MFNDPNVAKITKKSIFGEERTDLPGLGPYAPRKEPMCKTCRYAIKGTYGYKNGHCYKYQKEKGKPNDVLFKGAKCIYYRKDRSDDNG